MPSMTEVAFKIEINPYTKEREVFAFFPKQLENESLKTYTSYSHCGQHSECALDYFNHRRWAKVDEYRPLYNELKSIGYENLVVLNKDFNQI